MHEPPLILAIDDDEAVLDIVSTRLEASGFQVITATDAVSGRAKAKMSFPDLILLDINMPGINGTEALLDFKNDKALSDIKIAFLSNMESPWPAVSGSNRKFAHELGAIDYIDKTKELDIIAEKVKEFLNQTNE